MTVPSRNWSRAAQLGQILSWLSIVVYWFVGAVFLFGEANISYHQGTRTFWGIRIDDLGEPNLLWFDAILLSPFGVAAIAVVLTLAMRTNATWRSARLLVWRIVPGALILGIGLWDLFNNS